MCSPATEVKHPGETVCSQLLPGAGALLDPLGQQDGEYGAPRRPFVAEPVPEEMPGEQREHKWDCEWHHEQYPWECTCGLTQRQGTRDTEAT